jgi:phospholipid/cholesterol/gamma-HCH transport system substrate-binding protein
VNEVRRERGLKLRVGVFVLVALVAFLGMIYLLGARARLFEARYTIYADFTEVGGLNPGATVRLAGVQIGRVSEVRLPGAPGGKVRVAMTIGKQFSDRIRKNSVARVETQGLHGDRIVEISVGTAEAPPARPGETIASRDPTDIASVLEEGAQTMKNVAALAESLRQTADALNRSRLVEEAAATATGARRLTDQISREVAVLAAAARRLTDQIGREVSATTTATREVAERVSRIADRVEKGPGLAHALLYDEPAALRRLNELLAKTEALVARVERGEGAIGVLTSEQSTAAARRLVAAMDRLGRMADRPPGEEGLVPALLFDPKYKPLLDDLQAVARNLRDVSERVAGGRGMLGSLVRDEPDQAGLGQASRDLQVAMANLRSITERIDAGEGTLGALIADPAIYERLSTILDGASRSLLLRGLIRGLAREEAPGTLPR